MSSPSDSQEFITEIVRLVKKYYIEPVDGPSHKDRLFDNPQFNALLKHAPSLVFVLNHKTALYDYFSENVKEILGYEAERYLKEGISFSMTTVHPDHQGILNLIYSTILERLHKGEEEGKATDLRFTISFKVRKSDGTYVWMMEQFMVIETDKNGHPFLTLVFMHDISGVKKDELVDLVISQKTNQGFMPVFATTYQNINNTTVFSKRELEILSHLGKGMASKDIADQLCISEHTVKTHRKNMLKKTDAKNTTELIRYASAKGLIYI
jgi:PAS domain S-box-containing protein